MPPIQPRHPAPPTTEPATDGSENSALKRRKGKHRYFETEDLQAGLARRTARGGAQTLAGSMLTFLITAAGLVAITRFLSDEDFGLFGMVMVLAGFAAMFTDLGLSRAVVQKPKVNHEQVSTLFWINMLAATLIAIIVFCATPLVVWFYQEPLLAPINAAMSATFVIGALGMQHRALLERRMEFGRLNAISIVSGTASTIGGVALAWWGYGYWALVAIPMISQSLMAAALWASCRWVPSRPRRHTGVRSMLAFGGNVTGFQFLNYFARNADNAMLGYAWGAAPLGLYTRAYSIMMLPATRVNAPLTGVVVPVLSRLVNQPAKYASFYRRCVGLLALATMPPVAYLLITADEVIPFLFGEEWSELVPVFLALGPAALMACTNVSGGWLYMSLGHVERQTRWSVIQTPILLTAMAIGLQFGPLGLAVAVSVVQTSLKIPAVAYAMRHQPPRIQDYLAAMAFPTLVCLCCAIASWLPLYWISMSQTLEFTYKTISCAVVLSAMLFATELGKNTRSDVKTALRTLRPSK